MKIVLLDSSYPINYRNTKIVQSLKAAFPENTIDVITWNRNNDEIKSEHNSYIVYNKYSPLGRLYSKLWNLYGYYKFIKQTIHDYDIIIASHWDMLMLASKLKTNDQILIYENLDIPTANNKVILRILQAIESRSLRKCSAIIFASRFFEPLYYRFNGEKIVLENKPLCDRSVVNPVTSKKYDTIAFIGTVRYIEIMKNLVMAVKNTPSINLLIHGGGPDLQELMNFSKDYENVKFTGPYDPVDLEKLYSTADVIWAVYPNKDYNVKYAISNKYHESIAYGKPCIFANNTMLGDFVQNNKIGITVNPYSVDDIAATINNIFGSHKTIQDLQHNIAKYSTIEKDWRQQLDLLIQFLATKITVQKQQIQ